MSANNSVKKPKSKHRSTNCAHDVFVLTRFSAGKQHKINVQGEVINILQSR